MKVITPSKSRSNGEITSGTQHVQISAPNIKTAVFKIVGTSPLVVKRFDQKTKQEFLDKIIAGSTPKGKRKFEPSDPDKICEAAKYIGETDGKRWNGFNASSIRCAMISACRLVNYKMTLAKLSLFVEQDGWDVFCPEIPLIRIIGESKRSEMVGRTSTGISMLIIRPMSFPWSATIKIRFDAAQFSLTDVSNLLARVGSQVGICEGRNDSKNSAGLGWGSFEIANSSDK